MNELINLLLLNLDFGPTNKIFKEHALRKPKRECCLPTFLNKNHILINRTHNYFKFHLKKIKKKTEKTTSWLELSTKKTESRGRVRSSSWVSERAFKRVTKIYKEMKRASQRNEFKRLFKDSRKWMVKENEMQGWFRER